MGTGGWRGRYRRTVAARRLRGKHAGWLAIVLVVLAAAFVLQPTGCNQTAHLALVKALADGSPTIDAYEAETCDDSFIDGHYYTAKAPGLAILSLPWYGMLRLTGLDTENGARGASYPDAMTAMPRSAVWQVGLWAVVLPFLCLLLCVRWAGERLVPGYGTIAAVTLGTGTLLLPFATVLFVHVLSATLAFAAFCILLRERDGPPRAILLGCAGLLAGLATTVEFPVALVALVLAIDIAIGDRSVARLGAFAGGVALGLVPLVAFDVWAFGSPFEVSYAHAVILPGVSGHDVVGANDQGFFGLTSPSARAAVELLWSGKGLLVLSPVVVAAVVGLACLRRSHRREVAVCGTLAAVFLVYNAAYYLPFGGWVPGPRFLVPALPFLAPGLAAAFRARAVVTLALALVSTVWMTAATLAEPLIEGDHPGVWLDRLQAGNLTQSLLFLGDGAHGWVEAIPVVASLSVALVLAVASLPPGWARRDELVPAGVALAGWAVVALAAPDLLRIDRVTGGLAGLAAVVATVAAVGLTLALALRNDRRLLLGVPLVLLALPSFSEHTKWSLVLAGTILVVLLAGVLPSLARPRAA